MRVQVPRVSPDGTDDELAAGGDQGDCSRGTSGGAGQKGTILDEPGATIGCSTNSIWALQSHLTNYFLAQQKLICKTRDGAKVTKKYDVPATPQQRAERHPSVSAEDKTIMEDVLAKLNPAAIQRQIQALTAELLTLTTSKAAATARPAVPGPAQRASAREGTKPATRILT